MGSHASTVTATVAHDARDATVHTGLKAFMKEFWNNIKNYAPNLIRWTLILSTTAFFGPKLFALAATKSYLFAGLGNWIAAHTPAFVYAIGAKLSFLTPAVNAISAGVTWSLNALAYGLETFSTLVMVAGQSVLGAGKFGAFTVAIAGLAVINAAVDTVLTLGGAAIDTLTRRNTTSNIRPAHDVAEATFGRVDRLATRAYNWTNAKLVPKDVATAEVRDANGNVVAKAEVKTPTRASSHPGVVHASGSPLPGHTSSPANPGSAGVTATHAHGTGTTDVVAEAHVDDQAPRSIAGSLRGGKK